MKLYRLHLHASTVIRTFFFTLKFISCGLLYCRASSLGMLNKAVDGLLDFKSVLRLKNRWTRHWLLYSQASEQEVGERTSGYWHELLHVALLLLGLFFLHFYALKMGEVLFQERVTAGAMSRLRPLPVEWCVSNETPSSRVLTREQYIIKLLFEL